jgi:lambda family phage portal protein
MGLFSLFRRRPPTPTADPQAVRGRYDAAQTTPQNQRHWAQADWLSADAALHPGIRRTLRTRARYEAQNNPFLAGMLQTLCNDVIGTGPSLQLYVPNCDPEDDRVYRVERDFADWTGETDLANKLKVMRWSRAVDGEGFGRKITNPKLKRVQLDMRIYEADQIANPTWILELGAIDGLRVDQNGNVNEWHFLEHHPGNLGWSGLNKGEWVPADQVFHLGHKIRPGQHRGVGEIVPALELFALLRRYTLATVTAAETAADFAALIHTNLPATDGSGMTPMPAWETMPISRGMAMSLPDGWDATQMKPEHPTASFAEFRRSLINEIARCLNMPYIVAALDSSTANYSSMRGDYLVYRKSIASLRSEIERTILDPLLADWLDEALLIPGMIPDGIGPTADWNWRWIWQGWEHVDPTKEGDAQTIRLDNNTTTLADECAVGGKDWRWVMRQRAAEKKLAKELKLDEVDAKAAKKAKKAMKARRLAESVAEILSARGG